MSDTREPSVGESLVAQGAIVMKYENAEMRSFAIAHRRNEEAIKDRALKILETDADAVACAYYSIPHKEHTRGPECTRQADDPCPVKHVEGVGIDAARELARLWGNNATRVYFSHEDDERVWLSGVFVDLETNTRIEVPYGVSKWGVPRGGGTPYTLNPRMLGLAIQAGVSKAARNAIKDGLPRSLSRAYFERAKELLGQSAAIKIPQLLAAFEEFDVTREMLETYYGAKLEELTTEQRKNLRAFFVAIREGLVDPKEHFAGAGGGDGGVTTGTGRHPQANGVTSPSSASAEVRGGTVAPAAKVSGGESDQPLMRQELHGEIEPPVRSIPICPSCKGRVNVSTFVNDETGAQTCVCRDCGTEGPRSLFEPQLEPRPAPSQPAPDRVQSQAPNDESEPEQPDFDGLGI